MSTADNEEFVIILPINRPPIYKEYSFIEGKNAKSIKFSLSLPKTQTLAIRTPTFIQHIPSSVVVTDYCPHLIRKNRNDFSCVLQVIDKNEVDTISFIFKSVTNIVRVIDNREMELPGIDMPDFVVKFTFKELYDYYNCNKAFKKKNMMKFIHQIDDCNKDFGNDDDDENRTDSFENENENDTIYQTMKGNEFILNKIATSFELDHKKPQVLINNVDLLKIDEDPITIINHYFKGYHNSLVFKCSLTPKAMEKIDNRIKAVKELVDTECSFLGNFLFLTGFFPKRMDEKIKPLIKDKSVFPKFEKFFAVAKNVLEFHSSVLGVFDKIRDDPILKNKQISTLDINDPLLLNLYKVKVSSMFFEIGEKFVIDRQYMKSFREIQPVLTILKQKDIEEVLHQIEDSVFKDQKLTFESYAVVPFQRPLKYPDLLRAIIKFTPKSHIDYSFLLGTLNYMKEICSKLDKYVDEIQNTLEILNIFQRISMGNVNVDNRNLSVDSETNKLQLLDKSNIFVEKFCIKIKNYQDVIKSYKKGNLYLFNKRILLTALFSLGKEKAIFFNKIETQSYLIECDPGKLSILFKIDDMSAPIQIFFDNYDKKLTFLSKLKACRNDLFVKYVDSELNFISNISYMKNKAFTHFIFAEEIFNKSMLKIAAPPMHNISGCILGQMMYFSGGVLNTNKPKKRIHVPLVMFDCKSFDCFYHQDVVTPKADMRMTLANVNKIPTIFLVGGSNKSKVLVFDQMKWVENPGDPIARVFHSCVSYNDQYLVVFGGRNEKGDQTNELLMYDIMKHSWNRPNCTCKSPCSRINHSCVIFKNTMIIHGGESNGCKLHDTWVFNFGSNSIASNNQRVESGEWAKIKLGHNNSCFPRSEHAAVIVNEHYMVVFGGDNNENKPFAIDLFTWEVFDFKIKGNFFLGMNKFAAIYNEFDKKIYCYGGKDITQMIYLNIFISLTLPDFLFESFDQSLMNEIVKFEVNTNDRKCVLVKSKKSQDLKNVCSNSVNEFIRPLERNDFMKVMVRSGTSPKF